MDFGEALADGSSHRSEASSTSTRELHSQHIHDLQLEVNALRLQVQALRSDLQTLEESLARVWVNQTGHHQRLSWLEGLIQGLRPVCLKRLKLRMVPRLSTGATPKASPAAAGPAAANLTEADPDHSVSGQGEEPSDDAASVNAWGLLAPLSPTTHAAVPEESQDPALWLSEPFSPFAYDPVHDPNLGDPASDLGSYDMVHSGERERSLDPEDIWYDSVRDLSLDAVLVEGDREEVATSVAEEPLLPAESLSSKRVFEDARWAEVAQEAKFRRVCQDLPKLPWEQGAWSSIFGPERNMIDDALRSSVQASYGSEEAGQLPPENLPSASAFLEKTSSVVRTRLRRFHLERPADDRREHAIKRLRALIMYDPDTTFLGMVVAKEAANLADDEALSYSFTCAFAKSASGSLIKRAGSLDRFGKWILSCRGTSPLRSSEVDLFAYFSHLQGEGAGATSCQHCVEALRFLHGVAVFQVLDLEEVFSARVLGIVRIMHVTKAPLAQRPPLTVEHLSLLEQFVTMNKDHRACVVGQLVFCAHACARWADSQRVQSLTMECDAESGVVLIVAGALGSKTAISAEARTRLLPYVALGKGVSNVPWAEAWMEARKEMGLQAGGSFLLPTWSERKYDWGDFEMGAAEATNYLREALISMGCDLDEVQDYGSHSMKTTVLTWCGRSTIIPFTEPEQRALGHHLDPTSKSPLTYSREYYLKLYAKVLAVFSTIQQNRFKPDLPGAASVAAMAQSFEEGNERGLSRLEIPTSKLNSEKMAEDGESDDSDHASIDLDRELERDDGPTEREVFRGVPWTTCTVHSVSGITHVKRDQTSLLLCNMTSSALESTAEFAERCKRLGLSAANLEVLQHAGVASFGQLCFSVSASPHTITDQTFEAWVQRLWVPSVPSEQQQTCLKKLLFESQTMSMGEIRQKMQPASEQVAKPLPPSERLARSQRQQARITGLVYTPETTPSHYLVDLFNDQLETGVIAWVAPEKCASRADEMQSNKKDKALQLMPDGQIKVNSKAAEVRCEASTDSKLRAAWQRRSLAMDMAGIATFIVVEKWVHHLFSVFARDVPEGYAPIQLRQMVNADKRLFMLAAEGLPADLRASRPGDRTPLDDQIIMLMFSPEISQYLVPMPKPHVPPPPPGGKALAESLKRALSEDLPFDKNFLSRAWKKGKGGKGGKGGDKQEDPAKRFNLPEGCCDRNDKNQPLCFLWNQGKCKWVVLVSYTVRGLKGMPVPTPLDPKPDAETNPESPSSASVGETPFALELFSGRGRLSQCLRRAGFTVLSMDHRLAHSLVPVCKTDLATEAGQAFVWSLLESCCPAFVHMGLPSDTASSRSSSGALRTSQYPLGCPDLTSGSLEATRVDEANRMYRFSFEVACFCLARGIPLCIENPPSSRLWQIFSCFAQGLKDTEVLAKWQALPSIDLHCCMFGGSRAKPLRLKCTPGLFDSLAVSCDKQHEHKPWSLSRTRVEIAEDASYPLDLCRRMVSCLLSFMGQAGQALPSAIRLHDQSLAAAGVQPRRHKPLIPEYKTVVQVPADSPIPPGAKVLSPSQLQGVDVAAHVATPMSTPSSGSTTPTVGAVTLGLWHSPSEFFHKAASLAHPMDTTKPVAMVTKAAIDSSLHGDPDALSEQRRSFLCYLEEKIRRLQPREDALHKGMPKYMQEVLEGKNLLAWEELLKETGYTDLDCVRFMKEGVRLVGCEEHPKDFAKKEDASLLSQATAEEVDAGFLERGMTADEVSAFFGHEDWGVVRRFVLVQDGVHPRDRDLCVIMIQDHDGVATYHICNALMFGASASVFAFVRVSRSLWWIINKCLKVPCACYFDDYPLFSPESSAAPVDQDVSRLLDLLGWRHAKSGSKGKPFDSSFDVLGTRLDLGEILSGKIVLANKVGRAEKILEKVSTASLGNGSFRQSLQVLIGHLNFASGFFAGRALRHVAYDLNHLMGKDWLSAKDSLDELGSRISVILQGTPPRSLVCNRVRQPILVWTDGSWEKGHAGIGAVEWDPITSKGAVWAGHVPTSITALWLRTEDHTQEQIISQVELYAMALIRHLRKEAWMHRRVIVFCDNEAARFAAIKGGSSSHSMNRLVQAWDHPNFDHPAYLWIERVPSFSNIADGPSRGVPEEALRLTRTSSCRTFETEAELETLLFSRRRKEMG
ncbi:unnamed protein product, partial [Symbiodinium sp. CCMP2592]